VRSWSLTST